MKWMRTSLRLSFFALSVSGWSIPGGRRRRTPRLRTVSTTPSASGGSPPATRPAFEPSSEVVGASGRVGSFFLCHQDGGSAVAVPNGLASGCLTPPGRPIFVATPSPSWRGLWERTLADRRRDLIFVGNGIPHDEFRGATVVVPHYSILTRCSRNETVNPIGTNSRSPKTYLYGKHSEYTAGILNRFGVSTEIIEAFAEIRIKAALKLVWASCMWLLCHSAADDGSPINVGTVHELRQETLDRLVQEMVPALEKCVGQSVNIDDVRDYLKSYSLSIPDAIPSKELALAELGDRNGVWLGLRTEDSPQLLHRKLIEKIAGKAVLEDLLCSESRAEQPAEILHGARGSTLHLKEVGLEVSATASPGPRKALKRVVIVGAGMLGSSVASFLAWRLPDADVRVLDLLPEGDLGRTTHASWAWLNANGKEPARYRTLNRLGLHAWKACAAVAALPSWTGSLVRFDRPPEFVREGGHPVEGPLSLSRIMELEPFASWELSTEDEDANEGFTYFFPDEGSVNPSDAVRIFRNEAKKLGVTFVSNQNVTKILTDPETGSVCGVETSSTEGDLNDGATSAAAADLVIVAAGVGAAAECLGGLPLSHKPGLISYAKPSFDTPPDHRLSRILVDPSRSSHVLQRPDGFIVAGGGALEVGGSSGTAISSLDATDTGAALLETARELSPSILDRSDFSHACAAIRPMPRDGLPAVGYLRQGLYAIVTHSGMTLGPLLSAMSAGEIAEHMSCDLLEDFRPTRLFQDSSD